MEPDISFHFSPRPNSAHLIPWRTWGEAAFLEAAAQNRPILLSISAVWCHWCHVMDETTYSDPEVQRLIQDRYLPVRIDRDLRPDIDLRYNMGGWPTTAFLTPSGDVLTGATYLPPADMASAATRVADFYLTHGAEIESKAAAADTPAAPEPEASSLELDQGAVTRVVEGFAASFDAEFGGFGLAPKFPQPEALSLLAERALVTSSSRLMDMARSSLSAMAVGGMYDHVEGGFFRYSTTRDWSVPHYEKMLEDHAGLIEALALTGQAEILDGAADYLVTTLLDPSTGLFAGSQDADEHYYLEDAEGRARLPAPGVDRRIYVSWNAALAVAFLLADSRLGRPRLRQLAERAIDRLWMQYRELEGSMWHSDGVPGQLQDQVWMLLALVRSGREVEARDLARCLDRDFEDQVGGGYLDRRDDEPLGRLALPLRPLKENALAAISLLEMGATEAAARVLDAVAAATLDAGVGGAALLARALDRRHRVAVRLTTSNPEMAAAGLGTFPYLLHEFAGDERAILCLGQLCLSPIASPEELIQAIRSHLLLV